MAEESPIKKTSSAKRARSRKKTAAQKRAEEELQWALWESRIKSVVLTVVCILAAVNELFFTKEPSLAKLGFIATVLGIPLIFGGGGGSKPT